MATGDVRKGDVGTKFKVTIKEDGSAVDLIAGSGVDDKKFLFEKPDGTVLEKDPSFSTDGSDGQLEYITQEGDIDAEGQWELQVWVDITDGSFHSTTEKFHVYPNIKTQ